MLAALLPRGIRNNNPGNIRLSKIIWQGQKKEQSDPAFVEFISPVFGLRALMKLLLTYHLKYGLDTVESVINRFAPPHENATDHYIHHVSRSMKVRRMDRISLISKPVLVALAAAIVMHENGCPPQDMPKKWYEPALYDQAAALALPTIN